MKLLKLALAVLGFIWLLNSQAAAQIVVKVKPTRPKVVVAKPAYIKAGHVWVAGHWQWDKRAKKYTWVKGRQVRNRRGYQYVPGYWVAVQGGGAKWVAGSWKRV